MILLGLFFILIDEICRADETDSDFDDIIDELRQMKRKIEKDQQQLQTDKKSFEEEKEITRNIHETDVICLNVGGEILATTRQTLTSLPKGLFSILFNGRWDQRLNIDDVGNIFFDFNPIAFRHLLDQLQLSSGKTILPPSDPSLIEPFEKMLKKLHLQHLLSMSNQNILTLNVNGQIITTQTSNLRVHNNISFSNNLKFLDRQNLFIDYHPKVFRHFLKFQREQKLFEINCENNLKINKQLFVQSSFYNSTSSCC